LGAPISIARDTGQIVLSTALETRGDSVFRGASTFGTNGTATSITIRGGQNTVRDVAFQTDTTNRWILRIASNTEAGSNAGSDLQIISRADDGSLLAVPLNITRSSGLLTVLDIAGDSPAASTLTESGGNVTITGGGKRTYSHILDAATGGDANLVFSGLVDGDTGTLYVHPAATNVTITLSDAFAFSPTGSTITINGGTGSTNHTIIAWENKVISSTNRVSVNASNYYR